MICAVALSLMRTSIITADTYRIAAIEQIRTFADIVKLPKRFSLFTHPVNPKSRPTVDEFQDTWFKQYAIEKQLNDSLWRNQKEEDYQPDSILLTEQVNLERDTLRREVSTKKIIRKKL